MEALYTLNSPPAVSSNSSFDKAVSRALGDFHFKPSGMDPAKCKADPLPSKSHKKDS